MNSLQTRYTPQLCQSWQRMRSPFAARDIESLVPTPHYWIDVLYQQHYLRLEGTAYLPGPKFGLLPTILVEPYGLHDPNVGGAIRLWQLALWGALRIARSATDTDLSDFACSANRRNYLRLLERHGWVRSERRGRSVLWQPRRLDPVPPFMPAPMDFAKRLFDPKTGQYLEALCTTK